MKPQQLASTDKKGTKGRGKSQADRDQEARERKRQKKHRGHAAGSRATGGAQDSEAKGIKQQKDPRIGSKKPVALEGAPVAAKQQKPRSEKSMLTPQAELEMLEKDARLDALLERLEEGEVLNPDEQAWVNEKLDRIDTLMQQLGISYDDDEEEEKSDDLMRLLKGSD